MAGRRTTTGTADRRTVIIEAAKTLFMERGIKSTTVREIGASAGILSGSLYHHFDSKLDIVDEILGQFCTENSQGYREIAEADLAIEQRIREMARYAFSLIPKHGAAVRIYLNEYDYLTEQDRFAYLVEHRRDVERRWTDVLAEGVRVGVFRPDVDPRLFYRFTGDVVLGVVHWFRPSKGLDVQHLADEFLDLLLHGIAVEGVVARPNPPKPVRRPAARKRVARG